MPDEFLVRILLGQRIVQHADIIVTKAATVAEAMAAAVLMAQKASRQMGRPCVVLERADAVRTVVWDSGRDGINQS